MKTEYEIVHVNKGRKSLVGKTSKSINGFFSILKEGESVIAAQFDINPKANLETFKRFKVGYRDFELKKDGISFSRYPYYEY